MNFSAILSVSAGVVAGPFLVRLVSDFFDDAYAWLPFVIIMFVGGILFAVGVGVLRSLAAGLVAGVVVFGALLIWFPARLTFIPYDLRNLPPPF